MTRADMMGLMSLVTPELLHEAATKQVALLPGRI